MIHREAVKRDETLASALEEASRQGLDCLATKCLLPSGELLPPDSGRIRKFLADDAGGHGEGRGSAPSTKKRAHEVVVLSSDDEEEGAAGPSTRRKRTERPRSTTDQAAVYPDSLTQIVYLDLDNWSKFFEKLPGALPENMFIHGFYGVQTPYLEPRQNPALERLKAAGCWKLHPPCLDKRDAADQAIVFQCGQDVHTTGASVAFTVVSGDRGFQQVKRSCQESGRQLELLDPHDKRVTQQLLLELLNTIADNRKPRPPGEVHGSRASRMLAHM